MSSDAVGCIEMYRVYSWLRDIFFDTGTLRKKLSCCRQIECHTVNTFCQPIDLSAHSFACLANQLSSQQVLRPTGSLNQWLSMSDTKRLVSIHQNPFWRKSCTNASVHVQSLFLKSHTACTFSACQLLVVKGVAPNAFLFWEVSFEFIAFWTFQVWRIFDFLPFRKCMLNNSWLRGSQSKWCWDGYPVVGTYTCFAPFAALVVQTGLHITRLCAPSPMQRRLFHSADSEYLRSSFLHISQPYLCPRYHRNVFVPLRCDTQQQRQDHQYHNCNKFSSASATTVCSVRVEIPKHRRVLK